MEALFSPRSVAIVGASEDLSKAGGRCVDHLQEFGFAGDIYPINPRRNSIRGLAAYSDLTLVPGDIDLVLVLVPAEAAVAAMRTAADLGVPAAIVCSSGFAESGAQGRRLQDELAGIARAAGMAVVGPNSLGLLRASNGLAATFTTGLAGTEELGGGSTAFVSQSGALGAAIFAMARAQGVGVGCFVSTGNEAVLSFVDIVEELLSRDDVSTVLGYVEGLSDGRRFVDLAQKARAAGKDIALLKVGASEAGRRAARSHTGALTGRAESYEAAFRRAGVLRARDPRELLSLGAALSCPRRPKGPKVGIVSMSGGAGVMIADACAAVGLEVAALGDQTRARLGEVLPDFADIGNPLDFGPVYVDPVAIEQCVGHVANDPDIDLVLLFIGLSPALVGQIEDRVADVQQDSAKPVLVAWLGGPVEGMVSLRSRGVPAFDGPLDAVECARQLLESQLYEPAPLTEPSRPGRDGRATVAEHRRRGRLLLGEEDVKQVLRSYGVPSCPGTVVTCAEQAAVAAQRCQGRTAVKAMASDLFHKSDVGAVRLGVDQGCAAEAYRSVTAAASAALGREVTEAVVQSMANDGLDVLVGISLDEQFGPLVTLGLGGVTVEVLRDVVSDLVPLARPDAHRMLRRLRSAGLFEQFRGSPARDVEALVDLLLAVSDFAMDTEGLVEELDLNPVRVFAVGNGCLVLDAAASLTAPHSEEAVFLGDSDSEESATD